MTEATEPEQQNDLAKRRRVLELTADMADLVRDFAERVKELGEIGVDTRDVVQLVMANFDKDVQDRFADQYGQLAFGLDSLHVSAVAPRGTSPEVVDLLLIIANRLLAKYRGDLGDYLPFVDQIQGEIDKMARNPSIRRTPMEKVIDRLFAEAPKLEDASGNPVEGQAPALECHVVIRPGITIHGALSYTPEGTLRMLTPTMVPDPAKDPRTGATKPVLAEQFFEIDDVVAVVLQRDVTASAGSGIIS